MSGQGWTSALGGLAVRGVVVLLALHTFGILWRPLLFAAVGLSAAAVVGFVTVRLLLLRWRGW